MPKILIVLVLLCFLGGCSEREGMAPVVESKWREYNSKKVNHRVLPGETLYAIAFRYDKDYRQLAESNHLSPPFALKVGQVISLKTNQVAKPSKRIYAKKPKPSPTIIVKKEPPIKTFDGRWRWPAKGKIYSTYAPYKGRKGINIAGHKGERVHAASGGLVAYAGNGLSGYGNLIIIKHNNQYLTAYGNNSKLFVKEGQQVKPGQVIAQLGKVDRKYWGLHFEIRKAGKPVNPLNYLQKA